MYRRSDWGSIPVVDMGTGSDYKFTNHKARYIARKLEKEISIRFIKILQHNINQTKLTDLCKTK